MLRQDEILNLLEQKYPYLISEFGIKKIGIFGSYTKEKAGEESDIDLVVDFERPLGFRFIELAEYLENLLGKRVEVLTPAGIKGIRHPHIARDIENSIIYV